MEMSLVCAILLFFIHQVQSQVAGEYYCADEIQKCTQQAEEFESRVQEMKDEAFKSCFRRPACHEEKKVFDQCYKATVRSMRSPFRPSNQSSESFYDTIENFRGTLDKCFLRSPFVPQRQKFGPIILDEDAVYAHAVYSGEVADRLWGLPELGVTRPSLDGYGICRIPVPSRVFGTGISRIMHSGDPKVNNLTSSCLLEESEVICYRQLLDNSQEYIQAVYQRDYAIRYCIQNVRTQTPCLNRDHSRLRSCICGAKENFDRSIQMDLLDCVRRSSFHNIATEIAAIHDSSSEHVNSNDEKPSKIIGLNENLLTEGKMVNGRCMCACPNSPFANHMSVMSSISKEKDENPKEKDVYSFPKGTPRLMQPSDASRLLKWKN